jgi:hypothetical protein
MGRGNSLHGLTQITKLFNALLSANGKYRPLIDTTIAGLQWPFFLSCSPGYPQGLFALSMPAIMAVYSPGPGTIMTWRPSEHITKFFYFPFCVICIGLFKNLGVRASSTSRHTTSDRFSCSLHYSGSKQNLTGLFTSTTLLPGFQLASCGFFLVLRPFHNDLWDTSTLATTASTASAFSWTLITRLACAHELLGCHSEYDVDSPDSGTIMGLLQLSGLLVLA